MARLIRLALQLVLFLLLVSVVIAVATPETGAAEKIVLAAMGVGLVLLAPRVRAFGARPA